MQDGENDTTTTTTLNGENTESNSISKLKSKKLKQRKQLEKETEKAEKRGVCYLSRIPPHMDHVKLKHILSQYGEIQRIYLVPKESATKSSRYNQMFSEGWVEFADKRVAKRVADVLNGEQIGGKKRSSFYYDLWNIKYLSKFKWDNLIDESAKKRAERVQKLEIEFSHAKRERNFYLSRVEKSRSLSAMEERLKKKQKVQNEPVQVTKVVRHFSQTKPIAAAAKSKTELSDDMLDAVFGGL